jgi:hypothetical protein
MRPSFSFARLLRLITVSEDLQKRHDLVFLLIGQPEIADRLVHALRELRRRPARHLLSRIAMLTSGKLVAGVVEVDDFFQALKVPIVHIGLDEVGARPLVHIPLDFAGGHRIEIGPVKSTSGISATKSFER